MRHALRQPDLSLTGGLFEDFISRAAGRVSQALVIGYARRFEGTLDEVSEQFREKAGGENARQELGACYGVAGKGFANCGDWRGALANYKRSIEWQEKTGQHHEIGGTYHQVGRVYEEQRQWEEAATNYLQALESVGVHGYAQENEPLIITRSLMRLEQDAAKAGKSLPELKATIDQILSKNPHLKEFLTA